MKQLWKIGMLIVILFLLAACAAHKPPTTEEMSLEKRQQLMHDIMVMQTLLDPDKPGEGDCLFADSNIYYMGCYDGYDVVFYNGMQFFEWRESIGAEFFFDNQYSHMYLLKDGDKAELRIAYENGWISDEHLFDLAKHFYQFQMAHADDPTIFAREYGSYADRYTSAGLNEVYSPWELPEDRRKDILYDLLHIEARAFDMDFQRPGEGDKIFADSPFYYHLGTYDDADAVLFLSNYPNYDEEIVGKELFCCDIPFSISVYLDGTKINLLSSYQEKILTDEDLFDLAKRFYQFQLEQAEDPAKIREMYGEFATRYE